MRVDKMIGNAKLDTRRNIKRNAKKGALVINGDIVKDTSTQVDPNMDEVYYLGQYVEYFENIYIMMNKPQGVLSATMDEDETVIDLLDDFYQVLDLSIAGRLDKDTTGLLLLSTDGKFVHTITSPNSNIEKTYEVGTRDPINPSFIEEFKNGVEIKEEDYIARPAKLEIIDDKKAIVKVSEGKFHLVKRLFSNLGNEVVSLKRIAIGDLKLDPFLQEGSYRELHDEELALFIN
ncbi:MULTISPECIES: pseudouridine synthase [Anaerococcus]|jgi:pseudouridylate synthase|uniref:16S rRNA pseudouridine(516) synthase n=1 Tax=Anaerococcus TaxID=165779 RepID=UPI00235387A0|nr:MULTISPECIES: pseudouridine synthase [Anaerococcus]MBS6106453.1 pseudouridine synthase [Anaerococcus sp.]MDU2598901.1 pseudouridine synthase [Anaerococcus sp.]MDU3176915.1 pseudouridine synthase [Anaerococcus sp.]MDU5229711.1 pseudouridine synthase [Anaerococcus sp.]MDU5535052.1 pseudouridine synthase [Anaerococcus sp.]